MKLEVSIQKKLRAFTLDASFTVENEVFALLGASGCGKSMTLKCIAGLETPDNGRIALNGRVLYDRAQGINLPPQKRHIGYLFQDFALFPNMTIAENIAFAARGTKEEKNQLVEENLRRFGLTEQRGARPAELSGGQQQRAALARILASDAELLLLDEPFSALDSYLRWQLELELRDVLKQYEGTALFVSHDRGEVYRLADRAGVIDRGRLQSVQETRQLFAAPGTVAATVLTGCKNISHAQKKGAQLIYASDWNLPLHTAAIVPDEVSAAAIRAHFLEARSFADEADNTFPMEILQVIEDTFSIILMTRPLGTDARPIRWEIQKATWAEIKGRPLYLHFPPDKIMLLSE